MDANKIATPQETALAHDMLNTLRDFKKNNSVNNSTKADKLLDSLQLELQRVAVKHLQKNF